MRAQVGPPRGVVPGQSVVALFPEKRWSQRYGGSRTGPLYGADNDSCPDVLAFATVRSLPTRQVRPGADVRPDGRWR